MPHSFLKSPKLQLAKYIAISLAYAEGMARRWAEQEIAKIIDKLRNKCPSLPVLKSLQATVDRIKSLTTSATAKANKFRKVVKQLKIAINIAKIAVDIISHFVLPSTLGIPPGPAGGVIYSIPQGVAASRAAKLKWLTEFIESIENEIDNINESLRFFDLVFIPLLAKVAIIETLLNRCAQDQNLTADERAEILKGLVAGDDNSDLEYLSTNGKIYKLKVVTNPNAPAIATQRQAIAYDTRGIAVLRGPLSFAGDPNILIKELKHRIDNQLP